MMLLGEELKEKMTYLPEYSDEMRKLSASERLMLLNNLYQIYIPSKMSVEIYCKMYLSMMQSIQKKTSKNAIRQRNTNFHNGSANGIIGGSDSFTIIGCSGIGKSSAISASMRLIGDDIIELDKPFMRVIPILTVQCPFDCSVKSLLLSILKEVDVRLGTKYYIEACKVRTTTDYLIASVSQCCLNNIGLLVVDEIQNVILQKTGRNLVGCLTQLINCSGISIAMVGTPEAEVYFIKEMQLARRALGLKYEAVKFDDYFVDFCNTVFHYQYVKEKTEITDGIIEWLYEHSAGVISVVISLLHDAQEISIIQGIEKLDLETLEIAYSERMKMLHSYLGEKRKTISKRKKKEKEIEMSIGEVCSSDDFDIYTLAMEAKEKNKDVLGVLKEYINITEIGA